MMNIMDDAQLMASNRLNHLPTVQLDPDCRTTDTRIFSERVLLSSMTQDKPRARNGSDLRLGRSEIRGRTNFSAVRIWSATFCDMLWNFGDEVSELTRHCQIVFQVGRREPCSVALRVSINSVRPLFSMPCQTTAAPSLPLREQTKHPGLAPQRRHRCRGSPH